MSSKASEELVSAQCSVKDASEYAKVLLLSSNLSETLDGLIDHLHTVVTIGTSTEEEEIKLFRDANIVGRDVVSENRYDEESSRSESDVRTRETVDEKAQGGVTMLTLELLPEESEDIYDMQLVTDEEELELSSDLMGTDVLENRYDEEPSPCDSDVRTREMADEKAQGGITMLTLELMPEESEDIYDVEQIALEEDECTEEDMVSPDSCHVSTDDLVDKYAIDEHEGYEVEHKGPKIKFGSHMIRDSVYIDIEASSYQQPTEDYQGADPESLIEKHKNRGLGSKSVDGLEDGIEEEDPKLVPAENCSFPIASSCVHSHDSHPLVSILKQTSSVQMSDESYHPRVKFFNKHKGSLSPRLKSLAIFQKKQHSVEFSSITLRTYPIILGDHPNCKFGAPLSIGWEYDQCDDLSVNIYEKYRVNRRKMKQLYLNSGCRRMLLMKAGYSLEEISEAINEVQIAQLHRKQSAEDDVGILSFIRSVRPQQFIPPLDMNLKGWSKNKSLRSRILEVLPSGKLTGRQSK